MNQLHRRDPTETLQAAVTRLHEAVNRSRNGHVFSLTETISLEQDALATVAILRQQINAKSSPIYRLPPESLAMVASYLNTNDLFAATHVSRHWRAILLSFPTLWSHIQHGNDEEMLTMLERSKSAPLRVSTKFGCPPKEVVDSLCCNSSRIVSLRSDNRAVLKKLLARPLTSLEVLSIEVDGPDGLDDGRDLAEEPAKLVPSLRVLVVEGNIGGLGFCVPHLTHFKFHGWYSQQTGGEMLRAILAVFRRCPMLEVVDVGWGEELYNPRGLTFKDEDVVGLPHLRRLVQEQYVQIDQPWLPDLLHLPRSCSIYLKMSIFSSLESIGQLSFPLHGKSPHLSDIRRLKFGTVYDRSEDVVKTFMEIVNGRGTLLSFRGDVLLGGRGTEHDTWAIICEEINAANLRALRLIDTGSPMVLRLDGCELRRSEGGSVTNQVQDLANLGNITTLLLSDSAVEPCLAALEMDDQEGFQWRSAVRSLVIYPSPRLCLAWPDTLQSLLRVSNKRKRTGTPFRSVTLVIRSTVLEVTPGELAALNESIERFEFLAGDDALDWDFDKYFIPDYDPLQRRRDESAFEVDES